MAVRVHVIIHALEIVLLVAKIVVKHHVHLLVIQIVLELVTVLVK